MPKTRNDAARMIAQHLFAAETAIDTAYGSTASLASILPAMRQQSRVAASVADDVFGCVARAMTLQAQARRELVEAHGHCKHVADRLNVTGYGDLDEKIVPDDRAAERPTPLRAVG